MNDHIQEPYIYQRLRTRGVEPLYLARSIERLEGWSERIFGDRIDLDEGSMADRIRESLLDEHLSMSGTHAVEVRLYPAGNIEVRPLDNIYLEPFPLRAIRPTTTVKHLAGDMLLAPTSAKEALLDICRIGKGLPSQNIPMWLNPHNEIIAIDGAAVVAVTDDEILLSQAGYDIEFELAEIVLAKTRHKIRRAAISYDDIDLFKEIVYIDYRGVAALESIGERPLGNIVAERIAKEVQKLENF